MASTDPLDVRHQVLAHLVHDVVAEALEQAHDGLRLAEQATLLLAHEALQPVFAIALAAQGATQAAHGLATHPSHVAPEETHLALKA